MKNREHIQKDITNAIVKSVGTKTIGILVSMRLGKTRCIINYFKKFTKKPRILVAYPSNDIKQSWLDEFKILDYSNENLVFTNFSSLKKHVSSEFDIIVLDEAHALSQFELDQAVLLQKNCKKMILSSGTFDEDTKNILTTYLNMNLVYEYGVDKAVESKIVADYEIFIHTVDLDTIIKTKAKNGLYRSEKQHYDAYTFIMQKMKKNAKDSKFLALYRNRISQNSISKRDYVKKLIKSFDPSKRILVFNGTSKAADSLGLPTYHSKTDNIAFGLFLNQAIHRLSLVNMAKAGITFKNLDIVILNGFTGNPEETLQIIGRALIMDYNDKKASIHVICLNEPSEILKLQKSLELLDQSKIKFIKN